MKSVTYVCGGLALILSAAVMASWHAGNPALIKLGPGIVPMQYNAALTHVLCCLSLLSALRYGRRNPASVIFALLAFTLTLITSVQYVTGHDYGIDRLLMDPMTQSQAKTAYPGRMAPNTALCFLLLSGALLSWHGLGKEESRVNTVMLLAGLVIAFSLTALAGYAFGFEAAYGWWSMSNMSPQTAVALFLEGAALAGLIQEAGTIREMAAAGWKPALAAMTGIAVTLVVAQAILHQGQRRTETLARAESKQVASIVETGFGNTLKALGRMQARWEKQNGTAAAQWIEDARNHLTDDNAYYSMGLMDRNYNVYREVSASGRKEFWKNVKLDRRELGRTAKNKSVYLTVIPDDSASGNQMIAIAVPLTSGGAADGFMLAAYSLDTRLNTILKIDSGEFYHYEVMSNGSLLADNDLRGNPYSWDIPYESKTEIQGVPVSIHVSFNAASYENGGLVFLIFISGLCVSILLANAMYKAGKIRRFAERLAESEQRYAITVEGAGVALWDWDIANGRVAWAGEAWRLFGVANNDEVPRDEKDVRALIPAGDNEAINEIIARDLGKGDTFTVEFRLRQRGGKFIWVQCRGKVIERLQGAPVRAVGIYANTSELRQAEHNKELMTAIVDSSEDAIFSKTVDGIIMSWNRGAENLFGYSAAEAVGRHVNIIVPPELEKEEGEIIAQLTSGKKIQNFETKRLRKDGRELDVSFTLSPLRDKEGRIIGSSKVLRDITKYKEYEAQLKRTNEELEQFAYIASHDLKAPLRGIDNLAKWIAEDLAPVLTDDAREKMTLLRGRVSRLEMLLEDILQYSRAGRIIDNPAEVDTADMVRQIAASISLPDSFRVSMPHSMPVLTTSYTPLEQVFLNLISNARKHHGREEGMIEVGAQDRGPFWEFTVADDGPGIPPEFHDRVFKMFQTLKPRDDKESSGLGLSIVKKLVDWQGGRVWIVSKAGQRGTAFHFLWPKKFTVNERKKDVA